MMIVADGHVIEIRVDQSGRPRSMIVSTELDYEQSWLFEEPGWQDLAVGVSGGVVYWWSARHLVVLPTGQYRGDPVVISAEEDIRLVFSVADDWLLVCETSALLVTGSQVVSRLDFGEVAIAARWKDSRLLIRDANGNDIRVSVREGRLVTVQ